MTTVPSRTNSPRRSLTLAGFLVAFVAWPMIFPAASLATSACTESPTAGSVAGHGYVYCGKHWRAGALPVRISINSAAPASIAAEFPTAALQAVLEWDPAASSCETARIICIAPGSPNKVSWASLGSCGASGAVLGVAHPQSSGSQLTGGSIQLNSSCAWFYTDPNPAVGVAAGALGGLCPAGLICPQRYDVQGILAHELGHVLGLGDLNPSLGQCWASDALDVFDYHQLMYACAYPASTAKRVLGEGDRAGLARMLADAEQDS